MTRMTNAGAERVTTFALGCELQADWKLPSAEAMLAPFLHDLPDNTRAQVRGSLTWAYRAPRNFPVILRDLWARRAPGLRRG